MKARRRSRTCAHKATLRLCNLHFNQYTTHDFQNWRLGNLRGASRLGRLGASANPAGRDPRARPAPPTSCRPGACELELHHRRADPILGAALPHRGDPRVGGADLLPRCALWSSRDVKPSRSEGGRNDVYILRKYASCHEALPFKFRRCALWSSCGEPARGLRPGPTQRRNAPHQHET